MRLARFPAVFESLSMDRSFDGEFSKHSRKILLLGRVAGRRDSPRQTQESAASQLGVTLEPGSPGRLLTVQRRASVIKRSAGPESVLQF